MSMPSEVNSVETPVDVDEDDNDRIPIDVEDDKEEDVPVVGGKRSIVWDHYHSYKDKQGKKRARCNYCPKNYAAESRGNGTSNMLNHMPKCANHPNYQSHSIADFCQASKLTNEHPRELAGFKKFDQLIVREAVAKMLMLDEMPFNTVEKEGFIQLMRICCPMFIMPSRFSIARDCLAIYKREKDKLRLFFRQNKQRVSLTTDLWTSNQTLSYMVLTAHFVDDDWIIRKRIINFMECPSHKGDEVGLLIADCLNQWQIESMFSMTVDNASANDKTVSYLVRKFAAKGTSILGGKYSHVRCVAHIINLIVQDGLSQYNISIERVRHLVKYVKTSTLRYHKFKECAAKEKRDSKKQLQPDVPTRWNSTFLMLERAIIHKSVFERYKDEDASVRADFSKHDIHGPKAYPTDLDWDNASFMATILEHFRGVTIRVSGCSYVTANIFFDEIACIYTLLKEWMNAQDESLRLMARSMKEKFDKYWGVESDKANLIFFVASMLDPRYKFFMVNLGLCHMFGEDNGPKMGQLALNALKELYEEYKTISPPNPVPSASSSQGLSKNSRSTIGRPANKLMKPNRSFYKEMEATVGVSETQSELEKYLAADRFKCHEDDDEFQVLSWWKDHQGDYPVLARLARDIFAIPISTVASESAFSTGRRVIDDFRASLSSSTAEALICCQNWLREGRILTDDEEFELIQKMEEELKANEGDEESGIGHED